MAEHYVYLYQTPAGRVVYVGYGRQSRRSMAHPGNGYPAFRAWLRTNRHEVRIAGAYRDATEAKAVEAALISALSPEFNQVAGDGPRFLPLGVPLELANRARQAPLSQADIGRRGRGTLLVYLSPGDLLPDGRRKFDPARPSDDDAVRNTERWWQIGNLQELWLRDPRLAPRTIVGIHGRVRHRFIVAALHIDIDRLGEQRLRSPNRPGRWQVPLLKRDDLDAHQLRGRRVEDVRFGQLSHQLHIWVDRHGVTRHPQSRSKAA